MAILTADEVRAKLKSDITVTVPEIGDFLCRKPDLPELIIAQALPMPLLQQVLTTFDELRAQFDGAPEQAFDALMKTDRSPAIVELFNRWVPLAVKQPPVVSTQAELVPGALMVSELPLMAKALIFQQTFDLESLRRQAAAAEFRDRPDGAAGGSRGAPVRDPPVDPDRADGAGGGA